MMRESVLCPDCEGFGAGAATVGAPLVRCRTCHGLGSVYAVDENIPARSHEPVELYYPDLASKEPITSIGLREQRSRGLPGRPRVYETNGMRQAAYRDRLRHRRGEA